MTSDVPQGGVLGGGVSDAVCVQYTHPRTQEQGAGELQLRAEPDRLRISNEPSAVPQLHLDLRPSQHIELRQHAGSQSVHMPLWPQLQVRARRVTACCAALRALSNSADSGCW